MFQQSITGHILLWFKGLLLQYDASVTYRMIMRVANAIEEKFLQSGIHHFFTTPSKAEALYKNSLIYAILSFLWQKCLLLIQKCSSYIGRINQNGINRAIYNKISQTGICKLEHLCAIFFALMLLVPHTYWNNLYAFIGALALSAVYLVRAARNKAMASDIRALPISLFLFGFALVVSVIVAPTRMDGIRIALFFLSSILFMLLCAGGIQNKKALLSFLKILLGGLAVLCVFAIIQRFIGVEVNPEFTDVKANEGMPGRVYATMSNPNNFAEIVVLLLPFAYAMLLSAKNAKKRIGWGAVILLGIVALTMSYSRSCYVAFALGVVIFIALYDWRWLLPLAVLAIACIPLLPETVLNRILTIGSMTDTSNASRIYIWIGVLDMLKEHFVTGIGIGPAAFAQVYAPYAHFLATTAPHSHMLYLELFVELGLLGGISFLLFMFACIKKSLATYAHADSTLKNLIIAGIASLGGICFVCIAEYIWFYPRVMFIFWIVVGILLCAVRLARKEKGI
ncbi:MAG: O-antigen ligase family protein [Clostridia bacterium]|nr:O-antigen ligase family protein [Clostridia bacterium]